MKGWLKFFGLSFFSDKISKQAVKRGYTNFMLGLFLALIFLFCGVLAADLLPFHTHYKNSSEFSSFARNAIAGGGLNLELNDGKISANRIVDTFQSGEDAAVYRLNGYELVVDVRPSDAYDDFEPYFISNDGKEQEITWDEYGALSDAAKRNFDFKIRYTSKELILTDELTAEHEAYLKSINSEAFSKLQEKQGELTRGEYKKQAYRLYVKAYYPDISAYESTGDAPLLRNYYYHNYVNGKAEKYLFIFDDTCVGSFKTDAGLKVSFYGFYKNFPDGKTFETASDADAFIVNAFKATSSFSVYVYFMNTVKLLPFIVLMPVALALLTFCVLRIMKSNFGVNFGGSLKIVGSYMFVGSLISAFITFICGYFAPRNSLMIAALLTFFLILFVRTAVFLITERITLQKAVKAETDNISTENKNDTLYR